jgi:hypothetical protein
MLPEGNQIAEFVCEAKKIICPRCVYYRYKREKDGGDDNNVDDKNEPGMIRGKKKKANRGAPVRVAWYFCIIPRRRRWFATRKEAQLLRWHN